MINSRLDYMFDAGFFGTRAPFFMDTVTFIVSLLPFFVAVAISFAKKKYYKTHAYSQIFIFAFSVIVLAYFEYGVRLSGGFDAFMEGSQVSYGYAFIVLVFHIIISLIALFIWGLTLFKAKKTIQLKRHKNMGLISFVGVVLTSVTGIWVYFLMFVY